MQPQPSSGPETLGWSVVFLVFFSALILWVGVALVRGSLVASKKKMLFIEFRAPQVRVLKRRQSHLDPAIAFPSVAVWPFIPASRSV